MSRIGKKVINIPEKVEVKISQLNVSVKGPKGLLTYSFNKLLSIKLEGKVLKVEPTVLTREAKFQWGTARTLLDNMVVGVTTGFTKVLEFNGVGYKAVAKGDVLTLNLGHSHPIDYKLPKGIEAKVTKNQIEIQGCSKELVGFVAAKVRSFRPPEPYKGKGLKYLDETIKRKAGKAAAKAK